MKKCVLKHVIYMTKLFAIAFLIQSLSMSVLIASDGNAQVKSIEEVQVSISIKNVKVERAFQELEKKTGYNFVFANREIRNLPSISLESKGQSVYDVLMDIAFQTDLSFKQVNENIHVKTRNPLKQKNQIETSEFDEVEIKGRVLDQKGDPLPGVTVVVEGTSIGTVTDIDGYYTISAPENGFLLFSFIGFETQRQSVTNKSEINVTLIEDAQSLEEVVVIGYGTQKRENLTGSISSISSKKLMEVPVSTVEQALQGNAAGVMVSQTGGSPGAAVSVRVRGIGSINGAVEPLYVVDGVPIENVPFGGGGGTSPDIANSPLATLNPGEIESIEILKDASATAIYGARGANGVVLITTKRGKSGKTVVTYDTYIGVQEPARTLDVLNPRQYMELQNEFAINDGENLPYPDINQTLNQVGQGTNWQNELYSSSIIQNHQITVSGGTAKTRFLISGNYFQQEGIVPNNGFERISFRANVDHQISEKVSTGISLTISNIQNRNLPGSVAGGNPLRSVLTFNPLLPVSNEEGRFEDFVDPNTGAFVNNPIGLVNEVTNRTNNFRPLGNIYLDYFILENLKFRSSVGFDHRTQRGEIYVPRTVQVGRELGGRGVVTYDDRVNVVWENTLNYTKIINNKHSVDLLLGQMIQTASRTSRTFGAQNFPNDILGSNVLENGSVQELPSSNLSKWALISYLGRLNYGYNDKYLLTLTMRADGSSRFGTNKRFGFFPSAAFAWRMIEEDFLKNQNTISDAKFRISYGLNGNQDGIGAYERFARLASRDYAYPIGPGNSIAQGFAPVSISNVNLGWEETEQLNIGFNLGFFKNRISLEADYFVKNTSSLLFSVPLPQSAFLGSNVIRNIGNLKNSGFEFLLNTINIQKPNFSWESSFNISFIDNQIVSLPGGSDITYFSLLGASNIGVLREGASFPSFYGWISDGVFSSEEEIASYTFTDSDGTVKQVQPNARPGDVRYRDLSGPNGEPDGMIGSEDRTIIGSALPDFFGGIRNQFNYKNFTMSFFLNFSYGNDIVNYNRWQLANVNRGINQLTEVLDRWTPDNPNTNVPAARSQRSAEFPIDTRFIEDGSFIRLRDLTFSYNLPNNLVNRIGASNARFYIRGSNLFTITNYSGIDPEGNSFNPNQSNLAGIEISVYPMIRMYTAGLTVQF